LSAAYGNKAYENKSARRLKDWGLSQLAEQEKQCGNRLWTAGEAGDKGEDTRRAGEFWRSKKQRADSRELQLECQDSEFTVTKPDANPGLQPIPIPYDNRDLQ